MKSKISLIALLVVSVLFSATVAFARSSGGARATIINRTGYSIEALYISPVTRNQWESCFSSYFIMDDGDSVVVELPRHANSHYFDIRCEYTNGREDVWYGVELQDSDFVSIMRNGRFNDVNGGGRPSHSNDDDDYYGSRY